MNDHLHVPTALPPRKDLSFYSVRGWVGPAAGLEALEARQISQLCWVSSHYALTVEPVA